MLSREPLIRLATLMGLLIVILSTGAGMGAYPDSAPSELVVPRRSPAGDIVRRVETFPYQDQTFVLTIELPASWNASELFMGLHLVREGRMFLDVMINPKGSDPVTRENLEAHLALEGNESRIVDSFETVVGGAKGTAFVLAGGRAGDYTYYFTSKYHDTLFIVSGSVSTAPSQDAQATAETLAADMAEFQAVISSIQLSGDFRMDPSPTPQPYP